jgi:20S proteasome subunit alpha 5
MRKDLSCKYRQSNIHKAFIDRYRYHTDPSGTFVRYDAKAIGSGSDAAQQSLQDAFHKVSICSIGWTKPTCKLIIRTSK